MTRAEYEEVIQVTCPQCARGDFPKQRQHTGEWVHEKTVKIGGEASRFTQTYCYASGLRNSRFAKELSNG